MKASDAAYEVLAKAGKPLHVKDLTATMVADGLWATEGKTPWDTLSAILGTEINQLGVASRFARRGANTFDLRRPDDPIPAIYEMGEGPKAWMFQGNPSRYDLLGGIAAGSLSNYAMNQHREHAVYGDRIFFFLSGAKAGVYAIGRVTSTAYKAAQANEFGEWKVDVAFEATSIRLFFECPRSRAIRSWPRSIRSWAEWEPTSSCRPMLPGDSRKY